jgi:hypothetical protein
VSIDRSEPFELQRVYWLQTESVYADLRVPFHPAGGTACFAGRSGWEGDRYRWSHLLELSTPEPKDAPDDIGDLTWKGDRLIERGLLAGGATYEEVWRRLPGDRGQPEVLEAAHACHVRVGNYAVTIVDTRPGGSFNACYRVRTTHGWEISAAIGELPLGPMFFGCVHTENPSGLTVLTGRKPR